MTQKEKQDVYKRAKSIKNTFGRPSMFSAIKYILKHG
jgi:hypothetical protein